jgi:Fe-S cluster assembly ATP-binding protein
MTAILEIKNLFASVEGKEILRGVTLTLRQGEVHALMGPNGSGKSTLGYVIAGHPHYEVTQGDILFNGESILDLAPDERAKLGIFLAFQYPVAVPGVSFANFLRAAVSSVRGYKDRARAEMARTGQLKEVGSELMPMRAFREELLEKMDRFHVDRAFARRYLNDGFSGGEKKRAEVLQMAMLRPKIAILDESDSGLDIDALRIVSDGINKLVADGMGALLITHYQRILDYVKPQKISIFYQGQVIRTGGPEIALMLEEQGYGWVEEHLKEMANG